MTPKRTGSRRNIGLRSSCPVEPSGGSVGKRAGQAYRSRSSLKRATLAYARGGWDFTTNVLDRARWARSHGGHPDPTWPLGEQLAVALVLDDDEFLQAAGCTRQQAIRRLDWDITDDAEAWIADVRAIL